MPECARCNDFTDNESEKQYQYCDSCLDRFYEVTKSGVIVEQTGGQYTITVTDQDTSLDGGREEPQGHQLHTKPLPVASDCQS